jgi:hypothetical protein
MDSRLDNLRLLKQFLWDFERYWAVLTAKQRKHDAAMLEVMVLLCALTLELRSGRVDSTALDRSQSVAMMALVNKPDDERYLPYVAMTRRYSSVNFESALIARDTIRKIILNSIFPQDEIRAALDAHPYFAEPKSMPSWRALWFGFELRANEIPEILRRFNEDFEKGRFTNEPEIRHVAGLCLWLSEIGEPGWPADATVSRVKRYIDHVFDERPSVAEDVVPSSRLPGDMGSAYGLGYRKSEDPDFHALVGYLNAKVRAWRARGLPSVAEQLLSLMSSDSGSFLRKICATATGPATYARLPVLAAISPDVFVAGFVGLGYEGRKDVLLALAMRYEHLDIDPDLATERPWLEDVHNELIRHSNSLSPVPRAFLREQIDTYLEKTITANRSDSGVPSQ